jgi:hypothetical protein
MHRIHESLGFTSLGLAALLALGCDHSTAPDTPTTGAVVISVSTIYSNVINLDPDGYTLSIDDGPDQAVSVNAFLTIGSLPFGKHVIHLRGLAANCSTNETLSRQIDISPTRAASAISFVVTCKGEEDDGGWWDY